MDKKSIIISSIAAVLIMILGAAVYFWLLFMLKWLFIITFAVAAIYFIVKFVLTCAAAFLITVGIITVRNHHRA